MKQSTSFSRKRTWKSSAATNFISWALGGPNQYSGRSMELAHKGMNLNDEHFGAIANHLAASLREFNVSKEDINQVLEKLTGMKNDILYR